jgi:antitoxin VapB
MRKLTPMADELMRRMGAKSKEEAVRRALENELEREKSTRTDTTKVNEIQDRVVSRMGCDPGRYDDKAYMDEMWGA